MRRCSQCGAEFDGMLCPQCLAHVLAEDEGGYFELPERLGGFQLLERVARGASGEVWRAFQPGPDREVALKVFLDPALGGVADRARFDLEAQALGKLDHPAVVPVYAAGEEGGFLFIASRWMPGGTLADLEFPEEKSRVVQKRIGGLVAEVVHAVAYAHRHGLIHRDIKPENVLVDREGRPYLADFGIALGANQGEGSSVSGTPGFMAPEQAQGEFAKTTADIFSLGAILYHLLVGCPPDSEEQRGGEGLERVDRELRAIVLRCLRGLPEERYQSAESLAEDLEDWLAGKPVSAYPVGPTVRLWKWSRRHPAIAALAFLSALILVVLGVTLVVSSRAIAEERNEAVAQRGIAERNERLARREEYRAAVYAASQGLAGGNLGQAQRLLDEQIPGEGEEDLRGFEWDALSSLTASLEWRRFEGHELAVTGLAFSPDSRYLASVGRDQRVFVQEVETGEVVMELPNGLAPKKGPLEIPLMAGLIARSRALREAVRSGEETFDGLKMKGRPSRLGELTAVVWAPDGERLATAGQGGMVRVWSFPEGKLVQLFLASVVKQMAYSDDGRFLVVAYRGREGVHTVAAFEVETGERVFLREHVGLGFGMREGELVFFDGLERELVFVELADWTELKRWECAESVSRLCFSEDGEELYGLADRGNEVWTWNLSTRKLVSIDDWKHRNVRVLVESSYGLVTSGVAQSVNLPGEVLRGHEDEVLALAVSPDEKWIASGGKDETIRLWSLPEVALRKAERERPSCPVSSMSPDGRLWLVDPPKGEVSIEGVERELQMVGEKIKRGVIGFSPDGSRFATWRVRGGGFAIEWWSADEVEALEERILLRRVEEPLGVGLDPRREVFVVSDASKRVWFFDFDTMELLDELPEFEGGKTSRFVLSPGGERVAVCHWPDRVTIGDREAGWLRTIQVTPDTYHPLVFTTDGKRIITGNHENLLVTHDVETGEVLRKLTGHQTKVWSLALSPDGRTLVSSGEDRVLMIWEATSGDLLAEIEVSQGPSFMGFDDESRCLLLSSWNRKPELLPRAGQK